MASIREALARSPKGPGAPLSWDDVGRWLRTCIEKDERRRMLARRRHELYVGAGDEDMERFIREVFRDPEVIKRRREWVEKAKFNNVIRRLVNERSTCYSVPAIRTVGRSRDNEHYQEVQRLSRQHEVFLRINRWGNLHHNLAVGPRVTDAPDGGKRPTIDVVSADGFFAVADPVEPSKLIALGFELKFSAPGSDGWPRWVVWTDQEWFYVAPSGHIMTETVHEHGYPRMPWVLFQMEPPSGRLLDEAPEEELVAAHRSVWFENILLLKESKSATKQPILAGDLAPAARGQAADSEVPIETPDGVAVNVVDMSMDLSMFRSTAQHIYETAAANCGLPPAVLMHQGVQSAEARELMLQPLKEQRRTQQVYLREFEREFAQVQSMVIGREMPELAFSVEGWSVDFGEQRTPLDPKTALEVFEQERRLGLTDTLEELQRRNPDATVKQAMSELERHIDSEIWRNELMRPLQEISGSMGAAINAAPGDAGQRANQATPANGRLTEAGNGG
jgi:hypothetical protein